MNIAQSRLVSLIEYAKEAAKLKNKPTLDISKYAFSELESSIEDLPGIKFNDEDSESWLVIERLKATVPAIPSDSVLAIWLDQSNDCDKEPTLKTQVERSKIDALNSFKSKKVYKEADTDFLIQLEDYENKATLQKSFQDYLKKAWYPWALEEKKRKKTVRIYSALYHIKQQLEGSITDAQLELVWGFGLALVNKDGNNIKHPVLTKLVELSINSKTMALEIKPREADPRIEAETLNVLNDYGVAELEKTTKEFLKTTDLEISPFETLSYESIIKNAATLLDPQGSYNERSIKTACIYSVVLV